MLKTTIVANTQYDFTSDVNLDNAVNVLRSYPIDFCFEYQSGNIWIPIPGEQTTTHDIYTTYKKSISFNEGGSYIQLFEWAAQFLDNTNLQNDKNVVDRLFETIKFTGLIYGIPEDASSRKDGTDGALETKHAMCGTFSYLFDDYCRTQGVTVDKYFMAVVPYSPNDDYTLQSTELLGDDMIRLHTFVNNGPYWSSVYTGEDGLLQTEKKSEDILVKNKGEYKKISNNNNVDLIQYIYYPNGIGQNTPLSNAIAFETGINHYDFYPQKGGDDLLLVLPVFYPFGNDSFPVEALSVGDNGICESDPVEDANNCLLLPYVLIPKGDHLRMSVRAIDPMKETNGIRWLSIVMNENIQSLNNPSPNNNQSPLNSHWHNPHDWNDLNDKYDNMDATKVKESDFTYVENESRWEFFTNTFWDPYENPELLGNEELYTRCLADGHVMNFFRFEGHVYMYDIPFMAETNTIIMDPFGENVFPSGMIEARDAPTFTQNYYRMNDAVKWHRGKISYMDSANNVQYGVYTVKTSRINDSELQWFWEEL